MSRINPEIESIIGRIYEYEASESVPNTGTGSRREGEQFELLMTKFWNELASTISASCDEVSIVNTGVRRWWKLSRQGRTLYLPCNGPQAIEDNHEVGLRWLEVVFRVSEAIDTYPGRGEAIKRFAPELGPYAHDEYPAIYEGLSTKFDDTLLLVEDGVLHRKILLEYKTAKSSKGRQIDGNAHERLSFQIMQYLEVALNYTRCSFLVMSNGAFVKYRNKYHVNFHVQAQRLRNFAWFDMDHVSTPAGYRRIADQLLRWIEGGEYS